MNPTRHNAAENVQILAGNPEPPDGMGEKARAEWDRLIAVLSPVKLLTLADRAALAMHCMAWCEFWECCEILERDGQFVPGAKGGIVEHPAARAKRNALDRVMKTAVELGITPSARSRIKTAPPNKDAGDAAKFLGVVG